MRRLLLALFAAAMAFAIGTSSVSACGGLVAPNGAIRLARATTLVEWHDGVEHYLTSFSYQGAVTDVGWIVPLPAVPTKVEEGGGWTLQRLQREVHPQPPEDFALAAEAGAPAQVLQTVQIRALDVTILKGSGQAVLDWCAANKFLVSPETRDHLMMYAQGSPIFMAAKYDVSRALASGQLSGDGAPVLITMPIAHLWVPLEVLANADDPVNADLFLLTDTAPKTGEEALSFMSAEGRQLPGAPGFVVQRQEPMNASLYHDLSTDKNMGWVRPTGYLTYLSLDAKGSTVTYDLTLTSEGTMRLATLGTPVATVATASSTEAQFQPHRDLTTLFVILAAPLVFATALVLLLIVRARSRAAAQI